MASPVYDTIGRGYVAHRRPDPRWEAVVAGHLGADAGDLVVNVGAGSGLAGGAWRRRHADLSELDSVDL
ncbi:MAG: hypothetical protein ABSG39_16040, partial [Acidimicrobiales bacterium]